MSEDVSPAEAVLVDWRCDISGSLSRSRKQNRTIARRRSASHTPVPTGMRLTSPTSTRVRQCAAD
jgi:hypothetical protein